MTDEWSVSVSVQMELRRGCVASGHQLPRPAALPCPVVPSPALAHSGQRSFDHLSRQSKVTARSGSGRVMCNSQGWSLDLTDLT